MTAPTKMHINVNLSEDVSEIIRTIMAQTDMTAPQVIEHFFRDIKKWESEEHIELNKGILAKSDGTIVKNFSKKKRFQITVISR